MSWKENKSHLSKQKKIDRVTNKKPPKSKVEVAAKKMEEIANKAGLTAEDFVSKASLKEKSEIAEDQNFTPTEKEPETLQIEPEEITENIQGENKPAEERLEDAQTRNAAMNLAAKTGLDYEAAKAIIVQAMEETEEPDDDTIEVNRTSLIDDLTETDAETVRNGEESEEIEEPEAPTGGRCPITGRFLKGNKLNTGGFQVNPQNIVQENGTKKHKQKTILKKLLKVNVNVSNNKLMKDLKEFFPQAFEDNNEEFNLRVLLEMKQLVLAFHKDGKISQAAITAIKNRVDGNVTQKTKNETKITTTEKGQETFLHLFQQGDVPDDIK